VKRKQPKHLEVSEALRLLDAVPDQHRDMILLALTTGFRRNEILGLQWEWIDFGAMRIDLGGQLYWRRVEGTRRDREATIARCKYDSEREVPLYSKLAIQLGKRRQATGYVFLDPREAARGATAAGRRLPRPAYEASGLRRHGQMWHTLRHTYASVLAAGGVKRHEVEQLMGHKTVGTTGLYTHLFREAYADVERALDAVYGAGRTGPEAPAVAARRVRIPGVSTAVPRSARRF
jgi:integrase